MTVRMHTLIAGLLAALTGAVMLAGAAPAASASPHAAGGTGPVSVAAPAPDGTCGTCF